ncbi:MAG: YkgJ family cysteine cluster protein [Syntrophaceae bacterium]
MQDEDNPCLTCGACCACYRVSFYWAEIGEAGLGGVPVDLTEKLDAFRAVMRGTNQPNPRCIALEGEVGVRVRCTIYDRRPVPCRDLPFSGSAGAAGEEKCDKARAAWGLPLLKT